MAAILSREDELEVRARWYDISMIAPYIGKSDATGNIRAILTQILVCLSLWSYTVYLYPR